jgi:proton-translocating NADH-quinone oxidoreductase chain N
MTDLLGIAATFAPELVVLASALLVFLLDVVGVRRLEAVGAVQVAGSAVALVLVLADLGFGPLALLRTVGAGAVDAAPGVGSAPLYFVSSFGLVFQTVFLTAALLVGLASLSRESREPGAPIFFGLLALATLGMLFVALASDLIFLLLAIEITSISTYLLVGYTRQGIRPLEAAMKFYVIGAVSSTLAFFGASLLFGAYGTTNLFVIGRIAGTASYPVLALLGYGFLIAGLAFKTTLVPFHAWAVDVYDGAPTDVSAFLAGGSKKVGVFAFFLVFLGPVLFIHPGAPGNPFSGGPFAIGPIVQVTLGVVAVLTMTVGNVLALLQKEMKRLLAYSSISQAGYMLLGIAVGTAPALAGATFQVLAHVLMKGGAFLVVAGVAGLGIGPLVDDWRGLGQKRPLTSAAFALMLLSLAGVPLTVGFVSKFVLFSAAVDAKGFFVWLAVAGLLNSALSVFYYARVLKTVYFDGPEPSGVPDGAVAGGAGPAALPCGGLGYGRAIAIAAATVAIVAIGVYPQPFLGPIQAAATHFVALGA